MTFVVLEDKKAIKFSELTMEQYDQILELAIDLVSKELEEESEDF